MGGICVGTSDYILYCTYFSAFSCGHLVLFPRHVPFPPWCWRHLLRSQPFCHNVLSPTHNTQMPWNHRNKFFLEKSFLLFIHFTKFVVQRTDKTSCLCYYWGQKKNIGPNRLKLDLTISPCSEEKTCSLGYFAYFQTKHFNWPEADITNSTRHLNCTYARTCARL